MSTDPTDFPPPPGPSADVPDALTPPPMPRGHPLIAWAAILAAVATLFGLHLRFAEPADVKEFDTFQLQARYLVGVANLGPKPPDLYQQVQDFDQGPTGQRLRFAVLAGELKDPQDALKRLDALKGQPDLAPEDAATADLLERLYHDYADGDLTARDVTPEQRQELQQRLGWFGDLALNPRGGPNPAAREAVLAPAKRAVIAIGVMAVAALGGGAFGFVLLILFLALWRQMRSRFVAGSPFGGVYAETFALWIVLFLGLNIGSAFLPHSLRSELVAGVAALLSLVVLGWPVLRGVPWRQVRRDIGWIAGDRPALEPLYGVLCYLAALPLVLLLLFGLAFLIQQGQQHGGHGPFSPDNAPTHPIVDRVLHGGWWEWVQVVFVASVAAPILEETMFRGVLYRHMREATAGVGRWGSVILSALVVSFVFAALHPQGLLAVPVLMALAFGFTAAREWRGSLIPSMTVHALHNGALMLMLILAMA